MRYTLFVAFPRKPQVCRAIDADSLEQLRTQLGLPASSEEAPFVMMQHPSFKQWFLLEDFAQLTDGSCIRIIEDPEELNPSFTSSPLTHTDALPSDLEIPNASSATGVPSTSTEHIPQPQPNPALLAASPEPTRHAFSTSSHRTASRTPGPATPLSATAPLGYRQPSTAPPSGMGATAPASCYSPQVGRSPILARRPSSTVHDRLHDADCFTQSQRERLFGPTERDPIHDISKELRPNLRGTFVSTKYSAPNRIPTDAELFDCIACLTGHEGAILCCCVQGDTLYTGSQDRSVRVWDLQSMVCTYILEEHRDMVRSICANEHYLFTGSRDKTVRVWSLDTYRVEHVLQGHTGDVLSLTASGRFLYSGADDSTVRVWDLETFTCVRVLNAHKGAVFALLCEEGMLYSGSRDHYIRAWDATTHACKRVLRPPHYDAVTAFAVVGHRLYSASRDKILKEWDFSTLHATRYAEAHSDWITGLVAADSAGILFSSSRDGTIKMWDADSLQYIDAFTADSTGSVHAIALYGAILVSVGADRTVKVWRFRETGGPAGPLE